MRISKATVIIGLFIIVSASFMRQLMEFLTGCLGEENFTFLIALAFISVGIVFFIYLLKDKPGVKRSILITVVLLIGVILAWRIKIPQERIHILEYGLLGWFAGWDLINKDRKSRGIFFAWMFTIMVGVLDEAFQKILPYRVWDVRDILFNSLGGLWGIGLYWLK